MNEAILKQLFSAFVKGNLDIDGGLDIQLKGNVDLTLSIKGAAKGVVDGNLGVDGNTEDMIKMVEANKASTK